MAGPGEPMTYRPALVRVGYAVMVVAALWWVGAVAAGPDPGALLVGVPVLVAAAAAGYATFWRPAVRVDDRGVRLLNVLRDVHVPWDRLEEVQTRYALTLVADGRAYRSWAAAAPGRPVLPGPHEPGGYAGHSGHGGRGVPTERVPDPRWTSGGGSHAPAASRSLRSDSGAAAFIVEQAWARWRDTPPGARPPGGAVEASWNLPYLAATAAGALLAILAGAFGG